MSHQPNNIFAGTQVVALLEVRGPNNSLVQPRMLVLGDTLARSQTTNSSLDMFPLRQSFREFLSPFPLSPQTHWIKIIYANHHSKVTHCTVTLDNEDNQTLTEAIKNLPWPKQEEFYMVKQFMVVK